MEKQRRRPPVIPFDDGLILADVNAGLLYLLAMTSLGVYGVIIAGWASNSKYAFLGSLRSAAQIVLYELAMGFALVCVLLAAQSMNFGEIVRGQQGGYGLFGWYFIPLFPMFVVYFLAGVAETNRAPFELAEDESAIDAPLMLVVAYYTYAERKIIGYMQVRIGPNRVGPKGWLQPIADAVEADARMSSTRCGG